MRWMWCGWGSESRTKRSSSHCIIPNQLASHVHARKHCQTARRLLVSGAQGTGKTYLAEAVIGRSRFSRVFWLRHGSDMEAFIRLTGAILADYDIITNEDDTITVLLSRCDDPAAAIVIDDFCLAAPHGPVLLDLLQEMRTAIVVVGDIADVDAICDRFDGVLVCDLVRAGTNTALPYDQLQLARGLYLDWIRNPWQAIWAGLGLAHRRLAQAIAVLDDLIPESLLACVEDVCAEATSMELHQAGALQFTTRQFLSERCAVLSGSVRRHLRTAIDLDALVAAANAVRLCWTRKTSSRRWALSLITHGEALAELFTESLLDQNTAEAAVGAFCDHLTVLGSLYIYAVRPQHALCSFQTSLSLISSLPDKATSHYLCMMRTLHCMANVYGSIGESERQNRALTSAFAIDTQLRRSYLNTRPSQRKTSRQRLRHKLRTIAPNVNQVIDLGDSFRRHSFTPSRDDHERKVRKRPQPGEDALPAS